MPKDISPLRMIVAIIVLFGVVVITQVLFPAIEAGQTDPSLRAVTFGDYDSFRDGNLSTQAATALAESGISADEVYDGWVVYRNEGCVQCHTQQVRAIVTDVGLGAVVGAADISLTDFDLTGHERLGPDLSSVGSRLDQRKLAEVVTDASARHRWTTMPSYDYLSDQEIDDLVAYLSTLR
ncbi:MAG: cbb3-type cytochrome c oxidase subunit II [Acidimicrobiia bacterium]|nr:cbb3-type cytochrome c oxidase subunit II [Acidimicrobiia bacterium]